VTDLLRPPAPPEQDRPRIDPRFVRRWVDARREEGRRRLKVLVAVGVVVGLLIVAVGVLYSPLVKVRHVRTTVAGTISPAAVRHLAGLDRRTLMIDVDGPAVASRLDADPWLGGAVVTRVWPGTVRIAVTQRKILAVVPLPVRPGAAPGAAGWAEVDPTGRVLADVASLPTGVPVVQGLSAVPPPGAWLPGAPGPEAPPAGSPAQLVDMAAVPAGPGVPSGTAAALAVLDSLSPLLRSDVVSFTAGGGDLAMVISPPRLAVGTVTVAFGDGSDLQAKVSALVTLLAHGDLPGVGYIDLTVPARPATAASAPAPAAFPPPAPTGASNPTTPTTTSTTAGATTPTTAGPRP
jgi:hypothetical protein